MSIMSIRVRVGIYQLTIVAIAFSTVSLSLSLFLSLSLLRPPPRLLHGSSLNSASPSRSLLCCCLFSTSYAPYALPTICRF